MKENFLVSIIITSYNYGRFLKQTIDSALNQSYSFIEVIVVDDGSTDNSREIILSYGDSIIPVLKENGGQASAFNAGFRVSRGDAICFVDSDDLLMPTVIEQAMNLMEDGVAKVHWPMLLIDEHGRPRGKVMHRHDLAEGDLRSVVARYGPAGYNWPSTSGNLWTRRFIEAVFSMPEEEYRIGPDVYLSALVPFFGQIKKLPEPQGCYRIHSENNTFRKPLEKRVTEALVHWDYSLKVLDDYCRNKGIDTNVEAWKENSWWHQIALSMGEIGEVIPEGDTFIFMDEDQWVTGGRLMNRYCSPFLDRDGHYWKPSTEDETGIRELERYRALGSSFIVFAAPAFWWFDELPALYRYLQTNFRCVLANSRLKIFDLRKTQKND